MRRDFFVGAALRGRPFFEADILRKTGGHGGRPYNCALCGLNYEAKLSLTQLGLRSISG